MTLPARLLLYAQQWEDQHAPQQITMAMREAADTITALRAEVERLRGSLERIGTTAADGLPEFTAQAMWHMARAALTAQEKTDG